MWHIFIRDHIVGCDGNYAIIIVIICDKVIIILTFLHNKYQHAYIYFTTIIVVHFTNTITFSKFKIERLGHE